jgi:hypothetical protein
VVLPSIDFARVGPAVGAPFSDVRLPDQRGRIVDLCAARAGKKALVVFNRGAARDRGRAPARPGRREPRLPAPRPFETEGLDERIVVHDGRVRAVVPFHAEKVEGPPRHVERVRYQARTDTLCHRPTEERLEVTLEPPASSWIERRKQ